MIFRRMRCYLRGWHKDALLYTNDKGAMVTCVYCKEITFVPNWKQGMK